MRILEKLSYMRLVELQQKIFAKLGFCNLFWRIDRELDRRLNDYFKVKEV